MRAKYEILKRANMLLNRREVAAGQRRLTSLPVSVYVDINLKCNLECPSCFRMDPELGGTVWPVMGRKLFDEIAHTLFPTAYRVILSGGGESITNPRFDEMLDLCLQYEVEPVLYSNGTTLTQKRIERLIRAGTKLGISIDGATQETFEELRYPAKWSVILRAFSRIKETRKQIVNDGFRMGLNVVVQKGNLEELTRFIELAIEYDVEMVTLSKLIPYFPALREKEVSADAIARQLVPALELANRENVYVVLQDYSETPDGKRIRALVRENARIHWDRIHSSPRRHVKYPDFVSRDCGIPWSETFFTPEGMVVVGCCNGWSVGDLRKETFSDIWNGERYARLRETVNGPAPEGTCADRECPFRR